MCQVDVLGPPPVPMKFQVEPGFIARLILFATTWPVKVLTDRPPPPPFRQPLGAYITPVTWKDDAKPMFIAGMPHPVPVPVASATILIAPTARLNPSVMRLLQPKVIVPPLEMNVELGAKIFCEPHGYATLMLPAEHQ